MQLWFRKPESMPPALSSTLLEALRSEAARLIDASVAPAMREAYSTALRAFDAWREENPETDAGIGIWLAALHAQGRALASCALALAAIRFRAKLTGRSDPAEPVSTRILVGIRRDGARRGRGQTDGLTWEDCDLTAQLCEREGTTLGLRDAALVATHNDGLLRRSECAVLEVRGLSKGTDDSGRLLVKRSKTDQTGEGAVLYLGAPTVRRIRAWLEAAPIREGRFSGA